MYFQTAPDSWGWGEYAGGVAILFGEDSIHWYIPYCLNYWPTFPVDLPSETEKIWRITLTRNLGVPRISIACNNKEFVDVELSDDLCAQNDWRSIWTKKIVGFRFDDYDRASVSYRIGKYCKRNLTDMDFFTVIQCEMIKHELDTFHQQLYPLVFYPLAKCNLQLIQIIILARRLYFTYQPSNDMICTGQIFEQTQSPLIVNSVTPQSAMS